MINSIKRFFDENLKPADSEESGSNGRKVELATAALLFELLKTDQHIDERETETLRDVLQQTFNLDKASLKEIIDLAETESHQATSLYEFTSLINADYDRPQKLALIENMWRVAFADHILDKYEEHLIRRIADLIYVPHSDFIKSKLTIRKQLGID